MTIAIKGTVPLAASGRVVSANTILSLLYFGYLLSFADRVIFGLVIKPIKMTMHLSDTRIGLLSGAAFALSYALFSPAGGWLVDRRSRKWIMVFAISFWSAATFATGTAFSFISMALARVGVGAGEGLLHPLSVSLIGDTVPAQRRPRAFATYMSAASLGSIFAMTLGGMLIGRLMHTHGFSLPVLGKLAPWQGLFFAAAIPGFVLAIVVALVMREPPRTTQAPTDTSPEKAVSFLKRYPQASVALFIGISVIQMGTITLSTWNINFYERVHHWDATKAALVTASTGGLLGLVGCLLAGPMIGWLRRRGHADAPLIVCLIAALAHTTFAVAGLLAPTPVIAMCIFPFASFWSAAPSVAGFSAIGEAVPPAVRARLAGLHTFGNGIFSNSLGPFLVGVLSDRLFHQADGLRYALVCTEVLAGVVGAAAVTFGMKQFRARMSEIA